MYSLLIQPLINYTITYTSYFDRKINVNIFSTPLIYSFTNLVFLNINLRFLSYLHTHQCRFNDCVCVCVCIMSLISVDQSTIWQHFKMHCIKWFNIPIRNYNILETDSTRNLKLCLLLVWWIFYRFTRYMINRIFICITFTSEDILRNLRKNWRNLKQSENEIIYCCSITHFQKSK